VSTQQTQADAAMERVVGRFRRTQAPEGYWWGELESNPTMEAEYVLLTRFLGSDEGERIGRVAEDIRRRQSPDGSWRMYHGGPGDVSTTIECYFALKLAGDGADAPHMARARAFVRERGGPARARIFTKVWLALFGQWDWEGTPVMPPELILLPERAPFSIYRFASWARATIVPLLVVLAQRPTRPVPPALGIGELYPPGPVDMALPRRSRARVSVEGAFMVGDRALRVLERSPVKPLRRLALRRIERWLVDHQEADGSWGGIQPPWVYALIALNVLGRPLNDPVMAAGLAGFRARWSLPSEDGAALRVQACLSPVWDTALALLGLLDAGVPGDDPMVRAAARWLVREEIRVPGDWAVWAPGVEPSGWAFEFDNDLYPDIDDTSIVVMALDAVRFDTPTDEAARLGAINRAVSWLEGLQSRNGGWAAFDRDNTTGYLAKIPFADFGEVLDPPSADVTAHVLEMYGRLGYTAAHPPVRRGLDYLYAQQEADGAWFGRWGVNYVYGVGAVLPALAALGEDMAAPRVRRAVDWLLTHQNADGGWGETCASYVDPTLRGRGESTASQTAWALVGLLAAGEREHSAVGRGITYLSRTQRVDGGWDEDAFTGCGFPGYGTGDQPAHYKTAGDATWQGYELGAGFMINYHLYRDYFPLWALGRYLRPGSQGSDDGQADASHGVDGRR
jgi:squalene-hopene/tetraprenyl-beta-curcumene cyclase